MMKSLSQYVCITESALLFSIAYPFDILKNQGLYHIKGGKKDFVSKAIHKNLQNVLFFKLPNSCIK
jgi:hypothetical protein